MSNRTGAVIAFAILAIGGYYAYKSKFWKKQEKIVFTTKSAIDYIIGEGKSTNAQKLAEFDPAYLKAWADGIYNGQDAFDYKGDKYNVQGGKKIQ